MKIDETFLIKHVKDLLYEVYTLQGTLDFDKWVEERTNELREYFASLPAKSEPTDFHSCNNCVSQFADDCPCVNPEKNKCDKYLLKSEQKEVSDGDIEKASHELKIERKDYLTDQIMDDFAKELLQIGFVIGAKAHRDGQIPKK